MEPTDQSHYPTPALSPDEMPEITRELTMLQGAVHSLHGAVNDIISKVQPVTREHQPEAELAKVPDSFPIGTELGHALRDLYTEVSSMENNLQSVIYRMQL